MPKKVEINQSTNNSSVLFAPSRSEIRIEVPPISISIPSKKKILNGLLSLTKKIVHPVALSSTILLSGISLFDAHPSLFIFIPLSAICTVSAISSFFLIYKEVQEE